MDIYSQVIKTYSDLEDSADNNVRKWFLMGSYKVPVIVSILYFGFSCIIGPKIMQNRKPLNIRRIILAYNVVQILTNVYLLNLIINYFSRSNMSMYCIRTESRHSEHFLYLKYFQWLFFINRSLDLLDTIFFVLRKKQSHVTFLHVYHHLLVFSASWFFCKYVDGGVVLFFAMINAAVHTIMYTYYLLSAISATRKFTEYFKKLITQMQIIQFLICFVQRFLSEPRPECLYSDWVLYLGYSQGILMIVLFANFYRKAYKKKQA